MTDHVLERAAQPVADGGLTVHGTGRSTFNGPLRLYRNAKDSRGAARLLERYQDEVDTQFGAGADVQPGIRSSMTSTSSTRWRLASPDSPCSGAPTAATTRVCPPAARAPSG